MPNLHSERHQQIECGRQIGGQHGSVEYKYIDYRSQTQSIRGVREKCIVSFVRECSQRSLRHMFVYCTFLPKQLDIFLSFRGFSCIKHCWAAASISRQNFGPCFHRKDCFRRTLNSVDLTFLTVVAALCHNSKLVTLRASERRGEQMYWILFS